MVKFIDTNDFKKLLKKLLPISFIYKLILIRDLPKTFKIKFGKYVLKFLITDIKDKKNNKLFTLRNFGGSTISRGFHLFSSQPKLATWIDNFDKNSFLLI